MSNTDELSQQLTGLAEEIEELAKPRPEFEDADGLPAVGVLIAQIRKLEQIRYQMTLLYRDVSGLASLDRRVLRNLERVTADLYAADSVPAALILLRTVVREKQSSTQVTTRTPSYEQVLPNLMSAAQVIRDTAEAVKTVSEVQA